MGGRLAGPEKGLIGLRQSQREAYAARGKPSGLWVGLTDPHDVSISGLHMVLAAGTFFWLVRALLALAPGAALLWPVKKIAAVAAMIGATIYCIFSGSDVATERSLIMTLVMFGAVLVDRPALSIRNLSIAALIVLALAVYARSAGWGTSPAARWPAAIA